MTILFISDLHLEESRPDIAEIFFNFLANFALQAKALFIQGDFFEVWLGDDDLSPFNQSVIQALRQATQAGLPIYFMHGNRDFLIGKRFIQATGCQLLPDEYVADVYGTPTLLMHGDTLCTADTKYLKFRKKSRTWLFKTFVMFKSLEKRRAIARHYREQSKNHTSTTPDYIMDVTLDEVQRVMQKHRVRHLIHGHTHRPNQHQFILNNLPATRTVLAPWHTHGSVLVCEKNGENRIVEL